MAQVRIFVSAAMVVIFSCIQVEASPTADGAPLDPTTEQDKPAPLDDNMAVTPAPALKNKTGPPNPRYYPYQQQLTYRTGYDSDYPKLGVDNWVIGFQYLFPKFLSPKLEAGADLLSGGDGHLHVGMRWIRTERSYWRPSAKLSLDLLSESKEGLGTIVKWKNYFVRGTGCLEYVVWNPLSLRVEYEILANFDKMRAMATLGVSHGW